VVKEIFRSDGDRAVAAYKTFSFFRLSQFDNVPLRDGGKVVVAHEVVVAGAAHDRYEAVDVGIYDDWEIFDPPVSPVPFSSVEGFLVHVLSILM